MCGQITSEMVHVKPSERQAGSGHLREESLAKPGFGSVTAAFQDSLARLSNARGEEDLGAGGSQEPMLTPAEMIDIIPISYPSRLGGHPTASSGY